MTDPDSPLHSLMPILLRFSSESAAIRRLVVDDEGFRCLVEDYILAHNTLQTLHKQRPLETDTIDEYSVLLRDLEGDINKYLTRLRGESF